MTPREAIEAMPDDAQPKQAYRALEATMREVTGRTDLSIETQEQIAAGIYISAKIARAVAQRDIATLLDELASLNALHLCAVEAAERATPATAKPAPKTTDKPMTTDERIAAFDALRATDRLPDFGFGDLSGEGN